MYAALIFSDIGHLKNWLGLKHEIFDFHHIASVISATLGTVKVT